MADADQGVVLERAERLLPLGLGAAAFVLYALWAPPSFFWLDSAELSAAGVGLGVAHPTGFPLYVMLARIASLFPVGELAFRVNLLSAASGALAVALVARLVIGAARGKRAALVGGAVAGAVLGSSLLLVRHATVAEVYAPTAALLALTLLLLDRVARGGGARDGLLLSLACGLGLGLHSIYRLLVPLPVLVLLAVRLRRGARWPLYAPALALGAGAAMQLEMPARSASGQVAALDWGHPRTLGATWDHLTARRIRRAYAGSIMTRRTELVAANARTFAGQVGDGVGPMALLLAALGIAWLAARRRGRFLLAALVVGAAGDAVYAVWINPMGLVDLQNGAPTALCLAALAGFGLAWLVSRFGRATLWVGGALAAISALPPLLASADRVAPGAGLETARRWSEAALAELPPRAVALTRSDSLSAGLMFLGAAEGARPDVAALVRQHLWDGERDEALLGASANAEVEIDRRRPLAAIRASGRPVYWEIGDDEAPAPLEVGMPLARLGGGGGDVGAAAGRLRRLFEGGPGGAAARRELAHAATNLGRVAFGRGDLDAAAALFDAALAARPDHVEALVDRGAVCSRRGDTARAVELTERALAIEPDRLTALVNAARYRAALGDLEAARRHARRALEVAPKDPRAQKLLDSLERR